MPAPLSTATLSRDELKSHLAMIEQAHKKNQAVSIGQMKGRLVVRATPRWNILVRAWYWFQGKKANQQYRSTVLQTLNDHHTDYTLKKQLYQGITSGVLPCFSSTDVARAKANKHSFFRRARISGIDNATSLLSTKTTTPQKSSAFFIESEQEKQSVIDHYRRSTSKGEISLIRKPSDFDKDDLTRTITCEPGQSLETSPGRLFNNEPVCLVLDFTAMNPARIASLNELFDHPPRFQGRQLGTGVSLVCLIHQDMLPGKPANPGPDFWRRMDTLGIEPQLPEISQPTMTDDEIIAQMVDTEWTTAPETPSGHQSLDFHQQNGHWHTLLFGGLQLSSKGRLEFQEGILAKLDQKSGYVELHNAPTDDPDFTRTLATATREQGFWANGQWIPLPTDLQVVLKHSEPAEINGKLADLKAVKPGQSYVCINEETFDSATANISLGNGQLLSSNTLETLLKGQRNLLVTGKLMKSQWVQLINQLHTMKPPAGLCITPKCPVPPELELEKFRLSPEPSHQVQLINPGAKNLPEALEYDISSKTQPQTLLSRMPMLSQQDMRFEEHFTPLMTALMEGKPVRIYGLESNPAIAKQLESLLVPEPYVFLAGRKIPLPTPNLTCAVPPRKSLPGLWQQLPAPAEVEPEKIPDGYQQQMTQQNMAQLSALYEALKKIPRSPGRLYPDSPQPVTHLTVLAKIAQQVIRETASDACEDTHPYHWRKALNDVIAKEYRGEPEVYGYVKAQIHQCFADPENRRVEGDSLRQWFSENPKATREDVKKHYWQLARYIAPQCLHSTKQMAPVPDENLNTLMSIMIQCLPADEQQQWKSQLPCTKAPPEPLTFMSGTHYRQAYNALIAADHEGRANPERSVHSQALELSRALASLPQPVNQDDIQTLLQNWFTPDILTSDFKDLALAMASGKVSHIRQLRRVKKLSEKLASAPIVMLKGEAGTGKTYTAEAVARQYASGQEPLILSLSPEHTQEDLFGQDALKPATVTIAKNQLPFCQHPETVWQSLCKAAGYPRRSSHVDITFDKNTRRQLQKTLSEEAFFAVTEKFEDSYTEFEPGPLMQWAEMDTPPVLILDEANLAKLGVLSPLLGLKKTPPRITIHGRTIELTQQHRIIFTGNPESYDGRVMDPELRKEVLTLYYRPMSQAALKEAVFTPALPADWHPALKDHATSTCMELYDQFHKVLPDHTFGPRDLKDILARIQQYAGDSSPSMAAINAIVWQSVFDALAGETTEDNKRQLRALKHWYHASRPCDSSHMEVTEQSFDQFYQHLKQEHAHDSFDFSVPSVKDLSKKVWRDLEKSAGKHAVIIEGEAGRGKDATLDRLLPTWLKQKGKPPVIQRINASPENWDEIKQRATEAMNNGTILVISELNTLPSRYLEGFFNEVLNGSAAEGFMLIATINPASYSGREKFSEAMQSRCTTIKIPSFTEPELQGLLARRYPGNTEFTHWLTTKHCQLSEQLTAAGSSVRLPLIKLITSADAMKDLPSSQWQKQFDQQYRLARKALAINPETKAAANNVHHQKSRLEREEKLCQLVNHQTNSPVTVILQPPGTLAKYDLKSFTLTLPDNSDFNALLEQSAELLNANAVQKDSASQKEVQQKMQTTLKQVEQEQQQTIAAQTAKTEEATKVSVNTEDSAVPSSWMLRFMPVNAIATLISKLPVNKAFSVLSSALSLLPLKHVLKLFALLPLEKLVNLVMKLPLHKMVGLIEYIPFDKVAHIINQLPMKKVASFFDMLPMERLSALMSAVNVDRLMEVANELPLEKLGKAFEKVDLNKLSEIAGELPTDRLQHLTKNLDVDAMEKATSKLSTEKLQSLKNSLPADSAKYAELQRILAKRGMEPASVAASTPAHQAMAQQKIATETTRDQIPFDEEPWLQINQLKISYNVTPVLEAINKAPLYHLPEIPKHLNIKWLKSACSHADKEKATLICQGLSTEQWRSIAPELSRLTIYSIFEHLAQNHLDRLIEAMPMEAMDKMLSADFKETPWYHQMAAFHKKRSLLPAAEAQPSPKQRPARTSERNSVYYKKDLQGFEPREKPLASLYLEEISQESEYTAVFLGAIMDTSRGVLWSGPLSSKRCQLLFQRLSKLLSRSGTGEEQENELIRFIRTHQQSAASAYRNIITGIGSHYPQNTWLLLNGCRALHNQKLLSESAYNEILALTLFNEPKLEDDIGISFAQELAEHPVYGKEAKKIIARYYEATLSARELPKKAAELTPLQLHSIPENPEQFRIGFLEQTLGKQVINQEWSNAPSGQAPDINRLARNASAFPIKNTSSEKPTIIYSACQAELEHSLIQYIQQHPPFNLHPSERSETHLNDIEKRIAHLVTGLFTEALKGYHDKARWQVVNSNKLEHASLVNAELAPGTYGSEALPLVLSPRYDLHGFPESKTHLDYQQHLDMTPVLEHQNEPNAIILDTERMKDCLREFMAQIPADYLYDHLFF